MAHPDPEASHCQWDPSALEAMSPIPASPVLPMYHSRFPKPWTFGVIRMNPVAMVEGLNDPVALAAAREMVTQKYLVYFHMHLDLPTPESRWCRYLIYPVAATLRPEFPPLGIASDMVMPIAPNEENRKNRHPITPIPTLPFKNCYFWYESELPVRVRRSPDSYCPKWAAELSPKDCSELGRMWETEFPRLEEAFEGLSQEEIKALKEKGSHTVLPPLPYPPTEMSLEVIPACDSPGVLDTDCELPVPYPDSDSEEACGETSSFVGSLASFVGDVFEMNILGWEADPASKFLPLVDMWLEVDEHLSEDTIPSPIDLYDEQRAIQRIIIDALDRRRAVADPGTIPSLPDPMGHDTTDRMLAQESDIADDVSLTSAQPMAVDDLPPMDPYMHSDIQVNDPVDENMSQVPREEPVLRPLSRLSDNAQDKFGSRRSLSLRKRRESQLSDTREAGRPAKKPRLSEGIRRRVREILTTSANAVRTPMARASKALTYISASRRRRQDNTGGGARP